MESQKSLSNLLRVGAELTHQTQETTRTGTAGATRNCDRHQSNVVDGLQCAAAKLQKR